MGPRYKPGNLHQGAFVAIHFDEQILPGTFEYALHHLMEHKVDLSAFDDHYHNAKRGACAYPPKSLLKIVLFAYSRGILGSRRIEAACKQNVQFMALAGEAKPDHATIAAFVGRSPEAIQSVFREVLLVCDQMGLIGKEMFAIDGLKLPSNASKEWSGYHDELRAKSQKLDRAVKRMLKAHRTDDKHQIIVEAQVHGAPQEQELLCPLIEATIESFQDLGLSGNILREAKLTADAGFHSEANLRWLSQRGNDAYMADTGKGRWPMEALCPGPQHREIGALWELGRIKWHKGPVRPMERGRKPDIVRESRSAVYCLMMGK